MKKLIAFCIDGIMQALLFVLWQEFVVSIYYPKSTFIYVAFLTGVLVLSSFEWIYILHKYKSVGDKILGVFCNIFCFIFFTGFIIKVKQSFAISILPSRDIVAGPDGFVLLVNIIIFLLSVGVVRLLLLLAKLIVDFMRCRGDGSIDNTKGN